MSLWLHRAVCLHCPSAKKCVFNDTHHKSCASATATLNTHPSYSNTLVRQQYMKELYIVIDKMLLVLVITELSMHGE
jgi:hypothetical protein